jgi:hypothetical protein
MTSAQTRAEILKRIAARISARYGAAGTVGKWFREVRRGPVRPAGGKFSICTVSDGGQRKSDGEGGEEDESAVELVLSVSITLQIAAAWDRVGEQEDWSARVESLREELEAWAIGGCGVLSAQYVSDDPADVLFSSGASEAAWVLEMELRRVAQKSQSAAEQ